ncbi:MAG: hypothetical protein EOM05_10535 [Clostridia bacterium]|nr:hypothetical protein [Clostridia bacterium]
MYIREKPKTGKAYSSLCFLIVALSVYVSQDALLFGTNINLAMQSLGQYITVVLIGLCMILRYIHRSTMGQKQLTIAVALVALIWLSCFVNGELLTNYIYKTLLIIAGLLISTSVDRQKFNDTFCKLILIIAIGALILYALYYIAPSIINKLPVTTNTNHLSYRFAIISYAPYKAFTPIPRSYGIFRECSVFAIFLNLALYIHLFKNTKISIPYVAIYSATIITTFSTSGIIVFLLIIFLFVFSKDSNKDVNNKNERKKKIFIVCTIFMLLVLVGYYTDVFDVESFLFAKFDSTHTSYGSGLARIAPIYADSVICLKNPLLGTGIYSLNEIYYNEVVSLIGTGTTSNDNSILVNYAAYGLIYGTIILRGLYGFFRPTANLKIMYLIHFILMFMLLSGNNITSDVLFYIIMFYGFSDKKKEVQNENIVGV